LVDPAEYRPDHYGDSLRANTGEIWWQDPGIADDRFRGAERRGQLQYDHRRGMAAYV